MTDYESLHDFLGGGGLATRAARILTSSGVAASVAELLTAHETDPDRFTEIRGLGPSAADLIYRKCEAHLTSPPV